jgi:hypothetical protein
MKIQSYSWRVYNITPPSPSFPARIPSWLRLEPPLRPAALRPEPLPPLPLELKRARDGSGRSAPCLNQSPAFSAGPSGICLGGFTTRHLVSGTRPVRSMSRCDFCLALLICLKAAASVAWTTDHRCASNWPWSSPPATPRHQ